ncbi:hypothetical protein THAOC_22512 [Thalassiosira oceanica]|uniref:Uncharacterized protein n=1 Tax=Thalassiosira oceanica TaxID=159749 RepID=K0SFN3_THAOC|nr:hypothetical protein THAOC_22512 [Thalassiosira oceanica]|eukprot:EJK57442.1 hypothetical protein THAOC_22512 [Thalassiosira oceanica]
MGGSRCAAATAAIVRGLKEIFKPVVFLATSFRVFVSNLRYKATEDEVTVVQGGRKQLGAPSPRRTLADCWALNELATDYSDATKPVTVNPALFGRCYRASDEEGKACRAWTPLWEALTKGRWRVGERCGLTGGPVPAPRPIATRATAVALCQPALYLIQPLEAGQPNQTPIAFYSAAAISCAASWSGVVAAATLPQPPWLACGRSHLPEVKPQLPESSSIPATLPPTPPSQPEANAQLPESSSFPATLHPATNTTQLNRS